MENLYHVLGVAPNASDDEIRKVYRSLAMRFHPDRNQDAFNLAIQLARLVCEFGVYSSHYLVPRYLFCMDGDAVHAEHGTPEAIGLGLRIDHDPIRS